MTTSRRTVLKYSAGLAALSALGRPAFAAVSSPIRIGVIYDLSGPFAGAGAVASSIGAQIAIDLVNERGGVMGKYKVEAVKADSQSRRRRYSGSRRRSPPPSSRARTGNTSSAPTSIPTSTARPAAISSATTPRRSSAWTRRT